MWKRLWKRLSLFWYMLRDLLVVFNREMCYRAAARVISPSNAMIIYFYIMKAYMYVRNSSNFKKLMKLRFLAHFMQSQIDSKTFTNTLNQNCIVANLIWIKYEFLFMLQIFNSLLTNSIMFVFIAFKLVSYSSEKSIIIGDYFLNSKSVYFEIILKPLYFILF